MAVAARAVGGCVAIRSGSATTSAGRVSPAPFTPTGVRWKGVISAPERVVGRAAVRVPFVPAIALAESTTRPPPSATSGRRARSGPWPALALPRRGGEGLGGFSSFELIRWFAEAPRRGARQNLLGLELLIEAA